MLENSEKCLVSEKSARTVTHECQKVNSGGYIYFLLSNQSARKVLFTCLANTNLGYLYSTFKPLYIIYG